MRKFAVVFALLATSVFFEAFAEGTYSYRTIKAESSSQNPGVMNVTTMYETKDASGEVKRDEKSQEVQIPQNGNYRIVMDGSDAGFRVEPFDGKAGDFAGFDDFDSEFRRMRDAFFSDPLDDFFYRPRSSRRRFPRAFAGWDCDFGFDGAGRGDFGTSSPYDGRKTPRRGFVRNLCDWFDYIRNAR